MTFELKSIETQSFTDQALGTSGLRKSVKRFSEPNYVENFIQSYFNVLNSTETNEKMSIVIGGDGRYYIDECIRKILQLTAANSRIKKVFIAQNGLMSTPAVSCFIRKYNLNGGIILTASHNPGGPDADFGIKFNSSNGGPALQSFTDRVFNETKSIRQYNLVPNFEVDITKIGTKQHKLSTHELEITIVDSVNDYLELMKEIFDFDSIRDWIKNSRITLNAMHGVTGPYVKRIFCDELGVQVDDVKRCEPLVDFGGLHPDPNLTYAKELLDEMKKGVYDFGAAFDGDGDRNMILGKDGFFVNPCDSVAVLASYLDVIPFFKRSGIKGFARSMPTSCALDRVALDKGKTCFETPTGWKFFGNLMDAGMISICGEESFGTGSDHIREKDGIWTVLAWLSVLSSTKLGVQQVLEQFWQKYGRNFFSRYDYENCDADSCKKMMNDLEKKILEPEFLGRTLNGLGSSFTVKLADNFQYEDPIDKSVTKNQVWFIAITQKKSCLV